jgi:hypothetical protein
MAGGVADAAGSQSSAPTTLEQTALRDALSKGSVHELAVATEGSLTFTSDDDVATDEGRQNIMKSGGVHAHVLIVGGNAYYSGNQTTLTSYFGLTPHLAQQVGSNWVRLSPTDPGYATVAADATLPSALDELKLGGVLSETGPTKIDGQNVVGIRATRHESGATGSVVMYVTSSAPPLPVSVDITARNKQGTLHSTTTLSDWGEPVSLTAPTNVVTLVYKKAS